MLQNNTDPVLIKKPHQQLRLTAHQEAEFLKCAINPLYFIDNYIYIRHSTKGRVPFKLFDYQKDLVLTYWQNRQVIAMCSRQLGKCVVGHTKINVNGQQVEIESLIKLSFKEKVINWLEKKLITVTQKILQQNSQNK